jgi:hypothetical protein
MTWTKQPPKERGYYWYRGDLDATRDNITPVVIYVSDGAYCGMQPALRGWQPFLDYASDIETFEGEWWDQRIPEPPA